MFDLKRLCAVRSAIRRNTARADSAVCFRITLAILWCPEAIRQRAQQEGNGLWQTNRATVYVILYLNGLPKQYNTVNDYVLLSNASLTKLQATFKEKNCFVRKKQIQLQTLNQTCLILTRWPKSSKTHPKCFWLFNVSKTPKLSK